MLSIGEFAKWAGVSVRMLRHYDRLGLLRPERVDEFTGYRFYSSAQFARANQLLAFKDLGFSLQDVGTLLAQDPTSAQVAAMLRDRRDELGRQIADDQVRLQQVQARLAAIEKENVMSTTITVTETELPLLRLVQKSVQIEEMIQAEAEMGPMFQRVNEAVDAAGATRVGPGVAHYTFTDAGMVAAAAEQIGDAPAPAGLEEHTLAAQPRALSLRHEAKDLLGIQAAWQTLVAEVERRGLRMNGPCREIYLQTPFDGGDASRWVIDLQQPVTD
ncbi:MerR family transcriptional regulator [Dermacoccaceae bacterium W4C1]